MKQPSFDRGEAHRWFAVELNNLAWDLVESPSRTDGETDRMLHAAHGACHHWLEVGSAVHHLRAVCLLATAYGAAGRVEGARHYAQRCVAMLDRVGDEATAFDAACAHGCAASAHALAGERDAAAGAYGLAVEAASRLGEDDRRVFESLYPRP